MRKLTDLDREIILRLNQNGRKASSQIARELGVAERTVRHRIRRLEETGIIKPVVVVNPAAFGYTLTVDIFCEIDIQLQEAIVEAIAAWPEVSYIAFSTGDQDISFQALFKSSEEMHHFITARVSQVPGIRRTRTVLVPRIVKDTYQWLPPEVVYQSTR